MLTSPHYPQSNGKLERFHRTLKEQAIRPKTPLCQEDARRVVGEFIEHYNDVRLHSANTRKRTFTLNQYRKGSDEFSL